MQRWVTPVSTLTGDKLGAPVEPSAVQLQRELGAKGRGEVTIPVFGFAEGELAAWVTGPGVTLVVGAPEGILGAGIVQRWRQDGEVLVFEIAEFAVLHELRTLNGVGASSPATRVYKGAGLADIVVQVLRTMYLYQGIGKSAWDLPVIWPSHRGGGVERRFEWWRFQTGQQVLDELAAEPGSPVIDFTPEWVGDVFRWRCRVGQLREATHQLNVSTPGKPSAGAVKLITARDFQPLRTEMWVTGNGQEAKIVWGSASVGARVPDAPRMVQVSAWGTVEQKARCNAIAGQLLNARTDSVEQWELSVQCGEDYAAAQFVPGDRLEIYHPGDALHPAGVYPRIVMSVSHDSSETVQITVQEVATQVDRLQSGIGSVLRRLSAAETQASNRSSTTIDEITGMVQRAERATANAQKAADDAKKRADAARREAEEARRRADAAKKSADSAGASARDARSRADSAYSSARSAGSSASAARSAAASAQSAANRAQSTAVSANHLAAKSWALNLQIVQQTNRLLAKQFPNNPPVIQP